MTHPSGGSAGQNYHAEGYLIFYLRLCKLLYCLSKSSVKISTTNILMSLFWEKSRELISKCHLFQTQEDVDAQAYMSMLCLTPIESFALTWCMHTSRMPWAGWTLPTCIWNFRVWDTTALCRKTSRFGQIPLVISNKLSNPVKDGLFLFLLKKAPILE